MCSQAIRAPLPMSNAKSRIPKLLPGLWILPFGESSNLTLPPFTHRLLIDPLLLLCRLWDLAAGKTLTQLTHHKKSVRALAVHPTEFSFASGSTGGNNIKKWKCPDGAFVHNFSGHEAIVNTLSVNAEGAFFSGGGSQPYNATTEIADWYSLVLSGDNGTITWWDYKTGLPFQHMEDVPQPGSLDAEAGVFCSTFDQTATRLITGGADKTIKVSFHSAPPRRGCAVQTKCDPHIAGARPPTQSLVGLLHAELRRYLFFASFELSLNHRNCYRRYGCA